MILDVEVSMVPFTITVDAESKDDAENIVKQMIIDDDPDIFFKIYSNIDCETIKE